MTRAREAALSVLSSAGVPLSAADVMRAMGDSCDQATVYRALRFLEERGRAESFVLHCDAHGTERYWTASGSLPGGGGPAHRHWFHCRSCHRFVDLGACTLEPLVGRLGREKGLRVTEHVLYLVGECGDCAERQGASPEGKPRD